MKKVFIWLLIINGAVATLTNLILAFAKYPEFAGHASLAIITLFITTFLFATRNEI